MGRRQRAIQIQRPANGSCRLPSASKGQQQRAVEVVQLRAKRMAHCRLGTGALGLGGLEVGQRPHPKGAGGGVVGKVGGKLDHTGVFTPGKRGTGVREGIGLRFTPHPQPLSPTGRGERNKPNAQAMVRRGLVSLSLPAGGSGRG